MGDLPLFGGGSVFGSVRPVVVEDHADIRQADFTHGAAALAFFDHQYGSAGYGPDRGLRASTIATTFPPCVSCSMLPVLAAALELKM